MGKVIVWAILVGVFVYSGYGLNLIRIAIIDKMANPDVVVWWKVLLGGVMMTSGLLFLGGFVYYRDKKRGKVRPPAWKVK